MFSPWKSYLNLSGGTHLFPGFSSSTRFAHRLPQLCSHLSFCKLFPSSVEPDWFPSSVIAPPGSSTSSNKGTFLLTSSVCTWLLPASDSDSQTWHFYTLIETQAFVFRRKKFDWGVQKQQTVRLCQQKKRSFCSKSIKPGWNLLVPTWTSQIPFGETFYGQTKQRLSCFGSNDKNYVRRNQIHVLIMLCVHVNLIFCSNILLFAQGL